jgi:hypothetical protein
MTSRREQDVAAGDSSEPILCDARAFVMGKRSSTV